MAKCQEQALFRYTWAGRDESFCCLTHAQSIQGVAQAMGYYVQLIPLSGDEQLKATCQNEVRANTGLQSDGALPSVEEVICPICQSIVRLYDGNKVGMHTPHSNANEPVCKSSGVEIRPAAKA